MKPIHIKEGIRYFISSCRAKHKGFHEYKGKANKICKQIVKDCWNGEFFQTSTRNFNQFWTRDFGMCTEALLKLRYKKEVLQTLDYALDKFQKKGHVTTAITPKGIAFDFPYYAEDSLPFLMHSLRLAKAKELIEKYNEFLKKEINYCYETVFDPDLGLIKKERNFSSIKDYAKRSSSCYGNCMLAMLSSDLNNLKLDNPFKRFNIKKNIKKLLWNRYYFYEDLNTTAITGDANVFPFWTRVFYSKKRFNLALNAMQKQGIDKPLPLKYGRDAPDEILAAVFNKEYEKNTVWLHLGLCFLDIVKKYDKKAFKKYIKQYKEMIEQYKTFPEVLDTKCKPYRSAFYYCDEGMLWASKYLFLTS